jgi:hypothetical protein
MIRVKRSYLEHILKHMKELNFISARMELEHVLENTHSELIVSRECSARGCAMHDYRVDGDGVKYVISKE